MIGLSGKRLDSDSELSPSALNSDSGRLGAVIGVEHVRELAVQSVQNIARGAQMVRVVCVCTFVCGCMYNMYEN